MITVKTYTEEVHGKPDGNLDWFTRRCFREEVYDSDYLALSLGNVSRDLFTEQ